MVNILITSAGINTPYINYLDCIGKKVSFSLTFKENIVWWDAMDDVRSFWANRKRGDISFTEWVKSILKVNCFSYFARDDLKPVCKCYASVAWRSLKKICFL